MALLDQVNAMLPAQTRLEISQYRSPTATTENTTFTSTIAAAAEGEFRNHTGVAYDSDQTRHHFAGVLLFKAIAVKLAGSNSPSAAQAWDEAMEALDTIRVTIGAQARGTMSTSSNLTPTEEVPAGETRKPDLDIAYFENLNPPVL